MGRRLVSGGPSKSSLIPIEEIDGCLKYSIVGLSFPDFPHKAEPLLAGKDHDGAVAALHPCHYPNLGSYSLPKLFSENCTGLSAG
jgi:hypothetical protein